MYMEDLKVNNQERRRVTFVDTGIPKGEAFSSQGAKDQVRIKTQTAIAQGGNKIGTIDLFRRREYIEDPRGGDSGNGYYSQRRKMIATPTNLGKEKVDHTLVDGATKPNHKGIVRINLAGSSKATGQTYGTRNSNKAHMYEKSTVNHHRTKKDMDHHSSSEKDQKDGLGMTEAVDQRAEAFLVGKITRARDYGTTDQTTSVMTKKREQSKQPSPFNNRAVRDNPSSASEGKYLGKHTTNQRYWCNNQDEELKITPTAEDLEDQVMENYRKAIEKIDRESKKRTERSNTVEDGVGENRINVLDIMATENTPVYLINLSRGLIESLNISKIEILLALSNQMNVRLDWATDALRDLTKERQLEIKDAINLVKETLTLYERNMKIIGILNGEATAKAGIAQHRGVLNELTMIKEKRKFNKFNKSNLAQSIFRKMK